MDTLRIGAIRYKNIDWLRLGETPGAAGEDGWPSNNGEGRIFSALLVFTFGTDSNDNSKSSWRKYHQQSRIRRIRT